MPPELAVAPSPEQQTAAPSEQQTVTQPDPSQFIPTGDTGEAEGRQAPATSPDPEFKMNREALERFGIRTEEDFQQFVRYGPDALAYAAKAAADEQRREQAARQAQAPDRDAMTRKQLAAQIKELADSGMDAPEILATLAQNIMQQVGAVAEQTRPERLTPYIQEVAGYQRFWSDPANDDIRSNSEATEYLHYLVDQKQMAATKAADKTRRMFNLAKPQQRQQQSWGGGVFYEGAQNSNPAADNPRAAALKQSLEAFTKKPNEQRSTKELSAMWGK